MTQITDVSQLPRKSSKPLEVRARDALDFKTYANVVVDGEFFRLRYQQNHLDNLSRGHDLKRLKDIFGDESVTVDEENPLDVLIKKSAVTED